MTFGDAIDVLLNGRIMDPSIVRLIRPASIRPIGAIVGDTIARTRTISSAFADDLSHVVSFDMLQLARLFDEVATNALSEATETGDAVMVEEALRLIKACAVVQRHCRGLSSDVA